MKEEVNSAGEMDGTFLESLKTNPFLVKSDYFDNLHAQILSNVRLADLKKDDVFKTPADYFQQLEEQVLSQATLPRKDSQTFGVPNNYFENLESNILAAIKNPKEDKKIRSIFSQHIFRYAAAILFICTIGLAFYLGINTKKTNINHEIAKLPDQEIIDYLNTYSDSNDMQFILENTDDLSTLENQINHL